MTQVRGADLLVSTLVKAGVEYVFGVSGDSVLSVYDALYDCPQIRYIGVRNEPAGVHMAAAYALASKRPGVFLSHVGPGAMNCTIGIANAYKDDIPLVVLMCQQEQHKLGRDVFHEIDQLGILKPLTKWCMRVTRPDQVARWTAHGFNQAMAGRRGPVVIEYPKDVLRDTVAADQVYPPDDFAAWKAHRTAAAAAALQAAWALLSQAQRPVLFAGSGVNWSEAWAELDHCARLLGYPVVTTISGKTVLPEDHVLWAGFSGTYGLATGAKALYSADVILAVGTKFSDNCTAEWKQINPAAKIIHVDIDPLMIGRQVATAVGIPADAKAFLGHFCALLESAGQKVKGDAELAASPRMQEIKGWLAEERRIFFNPDKEHLPLIQPQYAIREMMGILPRDVCLVTGSGNHRVYADRLPLVTTNSYFKSINFGTLGFAFPGAVGVKLARPDRPVVCLVGDGDFMVTLQDLETAVREQIPVTVVVFNNNGFQITKDFQKMFFRGRTLGQDFGNPDFAALARLFGAEGHRVERLRDLGPALRSAMAAERPAIVDVILDPEASPYPITSIVEQMRTMVGVR